MSEEDLRERLARVETKMEAMDAHQRDIKHSLRELSHRFNRLVMSMLTMIGGALLGIFGWLVKKLGG